MACNSSTFRYIDNNIIACYSSTWVVYSNAYLSDNKLYYIADRELITLSLAAQLDIKSTMYFNLCLPVEALLISRKSGKHLHMGRTRLYQQLCTKNREMGRSSTAARTFCPKIPYLLIS